MQLAEEMTEYKLKNTKEKCLQGQLLKHVLQNKKEVARLINQFIEPRKTIKEEELVSYTTNSYITKKYRTKEIDLVYKLRNKEIFFLLECQSKLDSKVDYRMINYCLDIMREWSQNKKVKKITSYPIVVPILIYTGNQKWNIESNRKEKIIKEYTYAKEKMNIEYNLVDMSKYSEQILLDQGNILSYAMLLEKAEGKKEMIRNLENIIGATKDKRILMELFSIIRYVLNSVLNEKIQQELLKEIDKKIVQ